MTLLERPTEAPVRMRSDWSRAKDVLLLNAVWRAWVDERPAFTHRECAALIDRSLSATNERIERLVREGWLMHDGHAIAVTRSLKPGPRFAGIDAGVPLERIT